MKIARKLSEHERLLRFADKIDEIKPGLAKFCREWAAEIATLNLNKQRQAMKRWSKRRFFKYLWVPSPPHTVKIGGIIEAESMPIYGSPLWIFGYEDDSEYDEDHDHVDGCLERGLIYGRWFSVACVDGEPGTHYLQNLTVITEDDFERARLEGFKV